MKTFLVLLPVLILIFGFYMYRFSGRKELMKMDLVQFVNAFVITPTIIIWIKTVVFFSLSNNNIINDPEDKFFIDTLITTISLFLYAFIVMHSLTKTFALNKKKDPLFDTFEHAEYFHLWLSHLMTYSGSLIIVLILGILNLFSPLPYFQSGINLYIGIAAGFIFSILFYEALRTFRVEKQRRFDRLMKLQIYVYTFLLTLTYILFKPRFSPQYSMYWGTIIFYIFSVVFLQFLQRSKGNNKTQPVIFEGFVWRKIWSVIFGIITFVPKLLLRLLSIRI